MAVQLRPPDRRSLRDYVYSAALLVPVFTSPVPGSTLPGSAVPFAWTANGRAVTEWWIYAGPAVGSSAYFDSGSLGTTLDGIATGLRTDGSTVFVRLWYRVSDLWELSDYTYTAFR